MNELIKQLAEQAGLYVELHGHGPWPRAMSAEESETAYKKFAELIVQECVEQIKICSDQIKNDDGYADDNIWPIMQSIVDAVAIDVKEHFGVES